MTIVIVGAVCLVVGFVLGYGVRRNNPSDPKVEVK
jgi:hypothetical protein